MNTKYIINKKIINKYNKLLNEVIEYYNVPGIQIYSGIFYLDTFAIHNEQDNIGIIVDIQDFINTSKFLMERYPYLLPFFQLYSSLLDFTDIEFEPSYFAKINSVIKEIRKNNSNSTNK